jgi:glycerol-3-phosphate cytidylyltransferase-like family protein
MSKEFVDAVASGNNIGAEEVFKTAMASKIGDTLEIKRAEVAKTFVQQAKDEAAEEEEVGND